MPGSYPVASPMLTFLAGLCPANKPPVPRTTGQVTLLGYGELNGHKYWRLSRHGPATHRTKRKPHNPNSYIAMI